MSDQYIPSMPELPAHISRARDMLTLTAESAIRTESHEYSGMYASLGIDNSFSLKSFKNGFDISIKQKDASSMLFEMKGIDAALANALRRIMIAEIPTIAIEHVLIAQNTGIMHDEVLSHRLGLIPMKIDPDMLEVCATSAELSSANSVTFSLRVCGKPNQKVSVYSSDLKWVPRNEAEKQKWQGKEPKPVLNDILITKLAPGQEIDLEVICVKGIGKTHAKWSPVCTAFYRMMPLIEFPKGSLNKEDSEKLVDLCPKDVFALDKKGIAVVAKSKDCTSCRACFEEFPGLVQVNKLKEHFVFSVESTGVMRPETIVKRAIQILEDMCEDVMSLLPAPENNRDE